MYLLLLSPVCSSCTHTYEADEWPEYVYIRCNRLIPSSSVCPCNQRVVPWIGQRMHKYILTNSGNNPSLSKIQTSPWSNESTNAGLSVCLSCSDIRNCCRIYFKYPIVFSFLRPPLFRMYVGYVRFITSCLTCTVSTFTLLLWRQRMPRIVELSLSLSLSLSLPELS